MLCISFPDNCHKERYWISSVLLLEFLGIEHEIRFHSDDLIRIQADGATLELNDVFFKHAAADWLSSRTLPALPLEHWHISQTDLAAGLVESTIPVIFGDAHYTSHDRGAVLGLDVFGSAFFMLSRYEEAVNKQRDKHNRFPAGASLAYREGFLDRPIIDEYVEILWAAMSRLWPRIARKGREYRTMVSCDVDHPFHPSATSFNRMVRSTAAKVLRGRTPAEIVNPCRNYLSGRSGNFKHDPYHFTVDWMMDVNERNGNTVVFNFIPEITDTVYDDTCPISHPAVSSLLKRIDQRGHNIGLHPGYRAFEDPDRMLAGLNRLGDVLTQAGIAQQILGGRNHYLRWSTQTPAAYDATGLRYDSTLGYADHAGFRCGTCHEYQMFDLHQRQALLIRQRPLICMDCSVTEYMGCGYTDATLAYMNKLKSAAQRVKGEFSLLWHNSNFEHQRAREIYCEVIS